jgi:HlyD family secretion protein
MFRNQYSEGDPLEKDSGKIFKPESWTGGRGILLGLGLGIAIALGGTKLFSNPSPSKSAPTTAPAASKNTAAGQSVSVEAAQIAGVIQSVPIQGTVQARDWVLVIPKFAGVQIKTILVDEGQRVEAGQTIAVLDNTVQQDQVTQANAQASSAQAQVDDAQTQKASAFAQLQSAKAQLVAAQTGVKQKQATFNQERAVLAEAESNLRRYRSLAKSGAISKQELESRVTTALRARESVAVALATIDSANAEVGRAVAAVSQAASGIGQTKAGIKRSEADLANAIARVRELKTQRERATTVTAPSSGIIAKKTVQVGGLTSDKAMFEIIRNGALELQAKVPETVLGKVRVGANVQVQSEADGRIKLSGQVREINPVVDNTTRQALLKIDLPSTALLKPGMFLKAALNYGNNSFITVATESVLSRLDGQKLVYVLQNGNTVRSQIVEVGDPQNGRIAIKKGLKSGDRVVVDGAGFLKDGDRVTVVAR